MPDPNPGETNNDEDSLETGVEKPVSELDVAVEEGIVRTGVNTGKATVKKLSSQNRASSNIDLSTLPEAYHSDAEELYLEHCKEYEHFLKFLLQDKFKKELLEDNDLRNMFDQYVDPSIVREDRIKLRGDIISSLSGHGVEIAPITLLLSNKSRYAEALYKSKIFFQISLKALPHIKDEEKRKELKTSYIKVAQMNQDYVSGKITQENYRSGYRSNLETTYGDIDNPEFKKEFAVHVEETVEYLIEYFQDKDEITEGDPDFKEAVSEIEESIEDTALKIDIDHDSGHAKVIASEEYSFDLKITKDTSSDKFVFYIRDDKAADGIVGPFAAKDVATAVDERHMDNHLSKEIADVSVYNTSVNDLDDDLLIDISSKVLLDAKDRGYSFDEKSKDYLSNLAKLIASKDAKYTDISIKMDDLNVFLKDESRVNFLRNKLENGNFNSLSELIEEYKVENPSYS